MTVPMTFLLYVHLGNIARGSDIIQPGPAVARGMLQVGCLLWLALNNTNTEHSKDNVSCAECREMSQVVALVHKVKGTFRRTDPCVKYMDRIVTTADSLAAETQPASVELDDDVDLDFFDRQDLGVLNRRLRKATPAAPLVVTVYPTIPYTLALYGHKHPLISGTLRIPYRCLQNSQAFDPSCWALHAHTTMHTMPYSIVSRSGCLTFDRGKLCFCLLPYSSIA